MKMLEKVSNGIVWAIFTLIAAFLLLISLTGTVVTTTGAEYLVFVSDSVFGNLLWLLLFMAAACAIYPIVAKLSDRVCRKAVLGLSLCICAVMAVVIACVRFEPSVDQRILVDVAVKLTTGDYSEYLPGGYMDLFPFQNTMVLYLAGLVLLFGENASVAAQLLNIVFWWLGIYGIYKLLKEMGFREKKALCACAGMLCWFPFFCYTTYIYGNVIGFSLAMFALLHAYRFFQRTKWRDLWLSALFIGLASLFKSNFKIVMVALMILYVLYAIRARKKEALLGAVSVFAACVCLPVLVNAIVESRTQIKTSKGIPMAAWVAMGVGNGDNAEFGWTDTYNLYVYHKNDNQYDAAKAESIGKIKDRMAQMVDKPRWALRFFAKKTVSIWNEPSFECFSILRQQAYDKEKHRGAAAVIEDGSSWNMVLWRCLNAVQSIIWTGVLFYLVLNRRQLTVFHLVFGLILIGGFLFHLLWEAKSQYTIYYFYLMIPYAVAGYANIIGRLKARWEKKR